MSETPRRTYTNVFVALLVLLGVTVGVAYIHLGVLNLAVALLVAGAKTVLVLVYFMHLKTAGRLAWVFAGASFVFLTILISITVADYVTR